MKLFYFWVCLSIWLLFSHYKKHLHLHYCRQLTTFDCMFFLQVLNMRIYALLLFLAKTFPLIYIYISYIWHSVSRYKINVLSYESFGRKSNPLPPKCRADGTEAIKITKSQDLYSKLRLCSLTDRPTDKVSFILNAN